MRVREEEDEVQVKFVEKERREEGKKQAGPVYFITFFVIYYFLWCGGIGDNNWDYR